MFRKFHTSLSKVISVSPRGLSWTLRQTIAVASPSITALKDIFRINKNGLRLCFHNINVKNMADTQAKFSENSPMWTQLGVIAATFDAFHYHLQMGIEPTENDFFDIIQAIEGNKVFLRWELKNTLYDESQRNALTSLIQKLEDMTNVSYHTHKPIQQSLKTWLSYPTLSRIPIHLLEDSCLLDFMGLPCAREILEVMAANTKQHSGLQEQACLYIHQSQPFRKGADWLSTITIFDRGLGVSLDTFYTLCSKISGVTLLQSPAEITDRSRPSSGDGLGIQFRHFQEAGNAPRLFSHQFQQPLLTYNGHEIQEMKQNTFGLPGICLNSGTGLSITVPTLAICKIKYPDFSSICNGTPYRILLIEDSSTRIKMHTMRFISIPEYHLTIARNKEELDQALEGDPFHGVISDHLIPEIDHVLHQYFDFPTFNLSEGPVLVSIGSDDRSVGTLLLSSHPDFPIPHNGTADVSVTLRLLREGLTSRTPVF